MIVPIVPQVDDLSPIGAAVFVAMGIAAIAYVVVSSLRERRR